jgi:cytochrome c-type biogenesis protein CcmF
MIQELGKSVLWSALIISLIRLALPILLRNYSPLLSWRGQQLAAFSEFICLSVALGGLISGYVFSDFSLQNVAENSHSALPLLYKIAGSWGNHEGSMLLWVWILSLYGSIMAWSKPQSNKDMKTANAALAVHGLLVCLLVSYLLKTSNPFVRVTEWVAEGSELNPLLQDPALAIHPPILYLGYVGFAVPYCYAIAAWMTPFASKQWVSLSRLWVLWAWSFLTLGIALGSLWAYYELGWGGWWFWDPVENASLLPWLTSTALVHTLSISQKKDSLLRTTWCLATITFILCLVGTFLVRSGVLTTVHAFAHDPERGAYLLGVIAIISILTITIGLRGFKHHNGQQLATGIYVPAAISIMTYLLIVMMITVLLGTLYPLLMEAIQGPQVSVGAPYFTKTFIPIGLLLSVIMAFAGYLHWQKMSLIRLYKATYWGISALLTSLIGTLLFNTDKPLAAIGLILSIWLVGMTFAKPLIQRPFRLQALFSSMILAHAGCGIMMMGMAADHLGRQEKVVALKINDSTDFMGYTIRLLAIERYREPTYMAEGAQLEITDGHSNPTIICPEKRFYPSFEALITKTALQPQGLSFFYTSLGGILPDERWTARLYYHPYILLIWIGAAIMALSGLRAWVKKRQGKR